MTKKLVLTSNKVPGSKVMQLRKGDLISYCLLHSTCQLGDFFQLPLLPDKKHFKAFYNNVMLGGKTSELKEH